jgi:polyphosphate kinase
MPESQRDPERLLNREVSWLDFNCRVLTLAEDTSAPLLERAKFLAIFASNLDEFYQVRVAGLKRQLEAGVVSRSPDGLTPREQLKLISAKARDLTARHAEVFQNDVMPALTKEGVEVLRWRDLSDDQKQELAKLFARTIFPVVTPLAVDPAHPFPYISNLSLNLAVLVRDPPSHKVLFARVKVPPLLPRFVALADDEGYVPLEDVIANNLDRLFPGMQVVEHHAFRVTRNAEVEVDSDGAEDLLQALEEELGRRRFSPAVRLEIEAGTPRLVLDLLVRELALDEDDVFELPGPLGLTGLWGLYAIDRPDLKDEPFQSSTHPDLAAPDDEVADVFAVLRDRDVLVHHPYESFTRSVQAFVEQAAEDPDVLAIKLTLYRTSGESPIVAALAEAARAGKQVVVIVEIKARFDEKANIGWARQLERSGCHVVYGVVGLKTHCKLCLVVRQEKDGLRRYVHCGTGNYNPKTARLYEDLGVLTADERVGADVSDLFNYLTGYSRQTRYRSLLVAPHGMRERLVAMIEREGDAATPEQPGYIAMKLNSLTDEGIVDALYDASQRGVRIDLLIRGICSLRPGVPGMSETIHVRSILGRFLEHSRIFYFRNAGAEDVFIGSADLMHRNLDRRVEAFASVRAPGLQTRLKKILELAFRDNSSAWTLGPDGTWSRLTPDDAEERVELQRELMSRGTAEPSEGLDASRLHA